MMFQRILVPLDGSERAEQALRVALHLARASGGSLLLVRVVSTLNEFSMYSARTAIFLQTLVKKDLAESAAYLARMAQTCQSEKVEARIAVFTGLAAEQILEVAHSQQIDLIVMCSHGYTGFKRWALGSIAQKVTRQSLTPVLLLREQNRRLPEQFGHSIRATVALDGSVFAESALLPAARLVTALSTPEVGELHLMQLVELPTIEEEFDSLLEANFDFRQTALREAGSYLQDARARLLCALPGRPGLRLTSSVEECIDVAERLVEITEMGKGIGTSRTSDLLALTTHGRSGLRRWLLGSVTERVLHGSTLPLLIVHPQTVETPPHQVTAEDETDVSQELPEKSQTHTARDEHASK